MKKTMAATASAVLILLLANCAGPNVGMRSADALSRAVYGDGTLVSAGQNPFIYTSTLKRNASDPAGVWAPTAAGNVLLLVTSSDLKTTVPIIKSDTDKNYYPMDKTYLYAMDRANTGTDSWRDFGAVLEEKDIPWADDTQDHVWAPDIDWFTSGSTRTYKIFVPVRQTGTTTQQIAVFSRSTDPFGKFTYSNRLKIYTTGTTEVPYAYDPGVFHTGSGTAAGDFYLTYCDAEYPAGRIHIAKFTNNSLTTAQYLGKLQINNLPGDYYMEGPDLVEVPAAAGLPVDMVFLQFAAKANGSEQEYIGYAFKTKLDFAADPVTGWHFGGWIQKQIDPSPGNAPAAETAEWTNHATIVPTVVNNVWKTYYFYQYSEGDTSAATGQMRQIAMQEIKFGQDYLIQGAKGNLYLGAGQYPFGYTQYSALTSDLSRGNEATSGSTPRIFINNPLSTSLSSWSLYYWFKSENGGKPWVPSTATLDGYRLRQFGKDVWVVEGRPSGSLPANGSFPTTNDGEYFQVYYSPSGPTWDDSNDFSQPQQRGYTATNRVPVFGTDGRKFGLNPKLKMTVAWNTFSGKVATVTNNLLNGDRLVRGTPYSGSANQEWEIEPVIGSDNIRIKAGSYSSYLYVPSSAEKEKVVIRALSASSTSMRWLIEPISGTDIVRIKNVGTGKYLTRGNPNQTSGDTDGNITIFSETLNTSWDAQKWYVEYR